MNKLLVFIEKVDIFSQSVTLHFNDREKFPTIIGGLLTIIIFMLTIALIINLGSDLVYRDNPIVNTKNLYDPFSPVMNVSEINLPLSIQLLDKNFLPFYDERYLQFQISNFIINRSAEISNQYTHTEIKLVNCAYKYSTFVNERYNYSFNFEKNNLKDSFCLNSSLLIGGDFIDNYFSNLNIKLKRCANETTSNLVCKSKEEIDNIIEGAYFEFYYVDSYVDTSQYYNPYRNFFSVYFTKLGMSTYKFIDIFFKNTTVSDDRGYFFSEFENITTFRFDYFREQMDTYQEDIILDFYINSSKNLELISRNYMKFQDLAAMVGGVIEICMIIGHFISGIFNSYKMNEVILNTLYNFKVGECTIVKSNDNKIKAVNQVRYSLLAADIERILEKYSRYQKKTNIDKEYYYRSKSTFKKNEDNVVDEDSQEQNIMIINKEESNLQQIKMLNSTKDSPIFNSARANFDNNEIILQFSEDSFNKNISNSKKNISLNDNSVLFFEKTIKSEIEIRGTNFHPHQDPSTTQFRQNASNIQFISPDDKISDISIKQPKHKKTRVAFNIPEDLTKPVLKKFSSKNIKTIENFLKTDNSGDEEIIQKVKFNPALNYKNFFKKETFDNEVIRDRDMLKTDFTKKFTKENKIENDSELSNSALRNDIELENNVAINLYQQKTKKEKENSRELDHKIRHNTLHSFENSSYNKEGILSINYLDILGMVLCRWCFKKQKQNYDLIEKANEDMKKYLDYLDIIKLLQEFTKLKIILLSRSQMKLFSHISKPKVDLGSKDVKNDYLHGKIFEDEVTSTNELFDAFAKLYKRRDSIIDSRLISLLDEDLRKCFYTLIQIYDT